VVIEGKFADHPQAREVVLRDARGRVQRGIANIAAAVVYPGALRTVSYPQLLDQLEASVLAYCLISESEETAWFEGTPAALLDALRPDAGNDGPGRHRGQNRSIPAGNN